MSTKTTIAFWGCIVSSSVWAASGTDLVKTMMAVSWLAFAGLITWHSWHKRGEGDKP